MVDVVSRKVRSRMMAGIRGKNTKPELAIRSGLHALGFRFRLHGRELPGKPDLVLPKWNAVIFAHGCFWHGHNCHLFRLPSTRRVFWKRKIAGNCERDKFAKRELQRRGWRVLTVWECALKGRGRLPTNEISDKCANWLASHRTSGQIRGRKQQ